LLVLRHSSAYSTAYGHLSGFAKGLKKGTRVSQGETIGYVGQSGWATGPHLHYEFRVNNHQVDPLAFISPPALPLESSQLKLFRERTREWGHTLTLLRDASAASAN
jgi:murein DD-endopeptidase MepM/ murein hydrolase activator NlpD